MATSHNSPRTSSKRGLDLKNEGNDLFKKRRFHGALRCYSAGISVVTQSDVIDEELLATLLSNRSGCYYEMGDYGELICYCGKWKLWMFYTHLSYPRLDIIYYCKILLDNAVKEAKKCTQLLMESVGKKIKAAHDKDETFPQDQGVKMPPLVWKNMYRMARALHFQNADVSEVMLTLKMMENQLEEADEYRIMARKMREQLEYYANMPSKNKAFQPSMLRARFQSPYVEYYGFGECNLGTVVDAAAIYFSQLYLPIHRSR